jgi:SAM-dependent methyltransferase
MLLFATPVPDERTLEKFYSGYYPHGESVLNYGQELTKARRLLDYVNETLSVRNPTILDIGSSYGFALREATVRGWRAYGVEISKDAVEFSRKLSDGVEIYCGPLSEAKFSVKGFDVITMFNVLEHSPDPIHMLRLVSGMLKKSGKVFVLVPNMDSILARVFGSNWPWVNPPFHLFYFNDSSIRFCLKLAGLRCMKIEATKGDSYNAAVVSVASLIRWATRARESSVSHYSRLGSVHTNSLGRFIQPFLHSPSILVDDSEIMAVASND